MIIKESNRPHYAEAFISKQAPEDTASLKVDLKGGDY